MHKTIKWHGALKQYKANEWLKDSILDQNLKSEWSCKHTGKWGQYEIQANKNDAPNVNMFKDFYQFKWKWINHGQTIKD